MRLAAAGSLTCPDRHAKSNNKTPTVQASSPATDVLEARMAAASSIPHTTTAAAYPGSQPIRRIPLIFSEYQSFSLTLSGSLSGAEDVTLILTETTARQRAHGRKQNEQRSHRFFGTNIAGSMSGVPIGVSSSDKRRTSQADGNTQLQTRCFASAASSAAIGSSGQRRGSTATRCPAD